MLRRVVVALSIAALAAPPALAGGTPHWRAWLCGPHASFDWCSIRLTTTVVHADGSRTFTNPSVSRNPPVDCFYVYPTVSTERRGNSDLRITNEVKVAAVMEAGEFEQDCRVIAPMYHQITGWAGTAGIPEGSYKLEYQDVLAAWHDYLAHDNHGRGVVLIGHSEGSFLLEDLARRPRPAALPVGRPGATHRRRTAGSNGSPNRLSTSSASTPPPPRAAALRSHHSSRSTAHTASSRTR